MVAKHLNFFMILTVFIHSGASYRKLKKNQRNFSTLELIGNKEANLVGSITHLRDLKTVKFINNSFTSFDFSILPENIKTVNLTNNEIETLEGTDALRRLENLKVLDLTGNSLKRFNLSWIPDNIEQMILTKNLLTKVFGCSGSNNKRLTKLSKYQFAYNVLEEMNYNCVPINVVEIDVHNNRLIAKSIINDTTEHFNSLTKLKKIDLSWNVFQFYRLHLRGSHAREIDLSGNKWMQGITLITDRLTKLEHHKSSTSH